MRSKYCEHYPDKCSAPEDMETFCERYSHYCEKVEDPLKANVSWRFDDNFLIPKKDTRYLRDVVPTKSLNSFTQNVSDFVFTSLGKDDIDGPYFYEKPGRSQLIPCYTQYSRVDSDQEPHMSLFAPFVLFSKQTSEYPAMITTLSLVIEPKEYLSPKMKPGAYFTVHSPYEAVNPHYKGVFMEAGKKYHVHIKLEEDHLLTPPENDCVDYIERWKSAGKKGPRSQKMCMEKCSLEYEIVCCGCISRSIMFPTQHQKCLFNKQSYCITGNDPIDEYRKCNSSCNRPCSNLKFHYTVEERPEIGKLFFDDDWAARMTYVSVYMEDPYITVRSQKPLLMVESCSYVGGFLCFWLCIFVLFTQVARLIHQLLVSYIEKRHPVVS
ncbi:uncharacterized protein LOC129219994 isoform X2 [Uloborus diversus]|nr:uncharacterized protein LOC129219994 isoform X2 [Uloborus diversus]